jgi:hypothetical protein
MNADECRRKAQDLFALAKLLTFPEDRTTMLRMAGYWIERAEEIERIKRIQQQQQQQQQTRSEEEPEAQRS